MLRSLRLPAVAAFPGLALCAAPADAATQTFGSDLSRPADRTEARQADTAYWQTGLASGRPVRVPADGQLLSVRIKGIARSKPKKGVPGGETLFHVQVLRPASGGRMRVVATSDEFFMPTTGGADRITTFRSTRSRLCAKKGDSIAFNTVGGWDGRTDQKGPYPMGTPLQIFASSPGSALDQFTGADKTNTGQRFPGSSEPGRDEELLMQSTLGTGSDANQVCPGGTRGAVNTGPQRATIQTDRFTVSRRGRANVSLRCQPGPGAGSLCRGKLRIQAADGARTRTIASARYVVRRRRNKGIDLRLNAVGRRLFAARGRRLRAQVVAETKPGGAGRTESRTVTLRPRGR